MGTFLVCWEWEWERSLSVANTKWTPTHTHVLSIYTYTQMRDVRRRHIEHTHTQALDGEALEEGGQKEDVDGEVCFTIVVDVYYDDRSRCV
jgi:hypothetical protein